MEMIYYPPNYQNASLVNIARNTWIHFYSTDSVYHCHSHFAAHVPPNLANRLSSSQCPYNISPLILHYFLLDFMLFSLANVRVSYFTMETSPITWGEFCIYFLIKLSVHFQNKSHIIVFQPLCWYFTQILSSFYFNFVHKCIYVHHMCAWCPWKLGEGIGSGVTDHCVSSMWVLVTNPGEACL